MKRDWKQFAGFSRTSLRRGPRRRFQRRIVAPERLESRNAPGVMLPILPFVDLGGDVSCSFVESPAEEIEESAAARSGASSEFALPTFGGKSSLETVLEQYQETQIDSGEEVTERDAPASTPAVPFEIAALDAAFASLGAPAASALPSVLNASLTASTLPVASQDALIETTPPAAKQSSSEAVSHATATGSGGDVFSPQVPAANTASSAPSVPASASALIAATAASTVAPLTTPDQLSAAEVGELLDRATRVTDRNDAIIAIVDRGGRILGVQVEDDVLVNIPDAATLVFAIDGAVAKARTAAFFSNDQAALTSRTIRFISQSTITEREVDSNPNSSDQAIRGPGFVAPVGLGGHFPPDVMYTPHVDLFAIEHTNRDSLLHPGPDRVRQTATVDNDGNPTASSGDDIFLGTRFGADFEAGQEIPAPESYGLASGMLTNAQSRGIATLPGGVPLYKTDPGDGQQKLVGGIGVFFPGDDGYASFEQNFVAGVGQTTAERLNAPRVLEAEYTAAVVASNGSTVAGLPPVAGIGFPPLPGGGRIDLVGITLESFGPHPFKLDSFLAWGRSAFSEGADTGTRMPLNPGGALELPGELVPDGWLVEPTASAELTADEVRDIIERGIAEAEKVRSAIRLPLGQRSRMALAVTDLDGAVLGLYRMPDSTFFSIDVAVAKARNVAYYADPAELKPIDQIDADGNGSADIAAGVAFTNRTFRFVAEARLPSGIDGTTPGPFSTLLTPGVDPVTAENVAGMTPDADDFMTALGFDAFNPGSNFHEDVSASGYQNGVVFFPGSTPLYRNGVLVAGLGISGDGVDQDDVVTFSAAGDFLPRLNANDSVVRADEVFVSGVRLPYQKFLRNPRA